MREKVVSASRKRLRMEIFFSPDTKVDKREGSQCARTSSHPKSASPFALLPVER